MARLVIFSAVLVCCGCSVPRQDYTPLIACEMAVASIDKPPEKPTVEQPTRRRWFRRRR